MKFLTFLTPTNATVTHVLRSVVTNQVAWSVSQSITQLSPTETAELIEMPFGLRIQVGPGNHALDGGPDPTMGRGNFGGKKSPL